ncbi:tetratricopeptide repeat protein [Acinetobacter silvestris]|uniref:Sel1 repeat family protein n=1 Tax=Acinetobacter silvestris TaxID=1977882 RepID=A0A1Y3CMN0_9GAMM|nr:tetratricopeptide repeat protein [Acinetobacter silvestris]OTG67133.1 hypothetical protein B9T28_00350 [Acinetobacter silvestris]
MSNSISNKIDSEPINPNLFEFIQQDNLDDYYQWVVDSESIAVATSDEQAQQRIDILIHASNNNHAAATILLGQWHRLGHYVPQNPDAAILLFQQAVNLGAVVAHLELADIGLQGLSEKINLQQAFKHLHLATLAGNRDAQYSFSQCFKQGLGTEKDEEQALYWLEQAAQNHHGDAQFELAMLLPLEHEQHLFLLNASAQNGNIQAMLCMATHAQHQQNMEQVLSWLYKAKAENSPRACYILAQLYRGGVGIAADLPQSIALLQQAADFGDINAYFELFKAYKKGGLGVRKNKKIAIKYLNLAKENQHIEAAAIEF